MNVFLSHRLRIIGKRLGEDLKTHLISTYLNKKQSVLMTKILNYRD